MWRDRALPAMDIQSVVLEGGSALHRAAWDAGVVDYVQLYVAPMTLTAGGVPLLGGLPLETEALYDRATTALGPDVLTEGYVHRPH